MTSTDWQPGDPIYANQPERLHCERCGTQVHWGPDMDPLMPCPTCGATMRVLTHGDRL